MDRTHVPTRTHRQRSRAKKRCARSHLCISLPHQRKYQQPPPHAPHPSHTHTHPSNAKSHNGISDGKNVLSSDDGQIDGEYSQMSEMINGRVLRQDHTHTHTNSQQYSLLHLYSHMQIHTQTTVSSTAEGCITVQDEIRQTFLWQTEPRLFGRCLIVRQTFIYNIYRVRWAASSAAADDCSHEFTG